MRNIAALLALLLTTEAPAQDYFQQHLDYTIEARLNDETDELLGNLTLGYTNNSPDTLLSIPFHIWPNAYSSRSTAVARQFLRNGNTDFHFADPEDRGALDGLNFSVDGQPVRHLTDMQELDIVHLPLPQPLLPGASITIRTPFRVDIPASFSRLGHVGDSYQMTQWYPKPAVYDRAGWHAMPYLDQGEFYSEFGDFEVRITLPNNYVVGATGVLQEADERAWLMQKAQEDQAELRTREFTLTGGGGEEPFPASSPELKTLTYRAEKVHDFAWFADKRFKVLHDTLGLAGGRTVNVWAMFTEAEAELWKESLTYLKRSTRYYSEQIGAYPYPQVTAVESALSAGGGMEYPMVTAIGLSVEPIALDIVITHEVGHNWFYGVLGSNERQSAWMDEGLNSYYEKRYRQKFYGDRDDTPLLKLSEVEALEYRYYARQGRDQPPETRSDSLSDTNYYIQAYSKPVLALVELERLVGQDKLDAAIRQYYTRFQFRHPQPEDLLTTLSKQLGPAAVAPFRTAMMSSASTDWGLKKLHDGVLHTAHTGRRTAPATAQVTYEDGSKRALTLEPGSGAEGRVALPNATTATLRTEDSPLDLYTSNNTTRRQKLQVRFFATESDGINTVLLSPIAGYNIHDGLQAGFAAYNRGLEPKKLEWLFAPLYGFSSRSLTGFAGLQHRRARPSAGVRQLLLKAGTQRWSDYTLFSTDEAYAYLRSALKAEFHLDHPAITQTESHVYAQITHLATGRPRFEGSSTPVGTRHSNNIFLRAGYSRHTARELSPFGYRVVLEYALRDEDQTPDLAPNHLRFDAELHGARQYKAKRFFRYRAYGAYFLLNDLRERAAYSEYSLSLAGNAGSDYRRDGLYFGRNPNPDQTHFFDRQVSTRQGAFRIPLATSTPGYRSNDYLLAANLDIDLPIGDWPVPLGVFLDAGYHGYRATTSEPTSGTFHWVGGLSLTALGGQVGLYAPFVADPDTKSILEQRGGILERITFRLNLDRLVPWNWIDTLF